MRHNLSEKIVIYGILLLWTFICLFPIYWTATTSFKTAASVTQGLLIPWIDFEPSWKGWRNLGFSPDTLFVESNPMPVKWMLHKMGKIDSGIRLPLVSFNSAYHEQSLEEMLKLKLIVFSLNKYSFWSVEDIYEKGFMTQFSGTPSDAVNKLESVLSNAVSSQMLSDVPLGAFLSGGVDSSSIVALMPSQSNTKINTFSIGFNAKEYDEAVYAGTIAKHLGTNHFEKYVTDRDALNVIPSLPEIYDEPFADSSQIPTYLVSQFAKQKVTVALSGDAGDELFGGYNRYVFSEKTLNNILKTLRRHQF